MNLIKGQLVLSRLYMQDIGAYLAALMILLVLGSVTIFSAPSPLRVFVGVFGAVCIATILGMIFGRNRRVRDRASELLERNGAAVGMAFVDGQEVTAESVYREGYGQGSVAFTEVGMQVRELSSDDWATRPPIVQRALSDISRVRSERAIRFFYYPDLVVEFVGGTRYRFVPIKQRGVQWRAGMTRKEMRALLVRIGSVVDGDRVVTDGSERMQW
ncbi:hypothetical protein [Microbacterium sp. NPDC057650]|uniref:hypothetical protein n=1 Tax=unclassified Microbacterium TaxID=2609290 RepID=UPI00366FEC0B